MVKEPLAPSAATWAGTPAGEGSCLAVLSPAAADAGLIAYEMAILVKRVGPHLAVGPRPVPAEDSTD